MHQYLIAIVFFFSPVAIAASIYHWVDAEGRSHYGDAYTPGAQPLEISPEQPNVEQLQAYRAQQQALKKVLTQQAAQRKEMDSRREQVAKRASVSRLKAQKGCSALRDQLDSLEAGWEVKRRRGYQTADKRNFTARRDRLRASISESCG